MRLTGRLLFLLLLVCVITATPQAMSATIHGLAGASLYSAQSDASAREHNISRYRLRLDISDVAGDRIFLSFNGSARNAQEPDINGSIPQWRIASAKIEYKNAFSMLDIALGRDYIGDVAGARVDGLHLKFNAGSQTGFGVFGGYAPDPLDDRFNSGYTTFGGYGFIRTPGYGGSIGYVTTSLEAVEDLETFNRTDSTYFYSSGYYLPGRAMSIYASARADRNIEKNSYELTNLLVSANFRFARIARVGLSYNQYRAIRRLETMDYSLSHDQHSSLRFTHVFHATRSARIFGKIEARERAGEDKSASLYDVGIRQSDLFNRMFVEVVYRYINYFTSNIRQGRLTIGAEATDKLTMEVSAAYSEDEHNNNEVSLNQWIYSASIDWYVTKRLYVSARYETSSDKYLDVDQVYLQSADDEYKSSSFYFQGSYRF